MVFALILCDAGVLRDAFLDESRHRVHIDLQVCPFLHKRGGVEDRVLDGFKILDQRILFGDEDVHCFYEKAPYLILGDVRRSAFAIPVEFVVALPDDLSVLVIGVPHLRAVPATAFAALDSA